jgi:hypothetical protein
MKYQLSFGTLRVSSINVLRNYLSSESFVSKATAILMKILPHREILALVLIRSLGTQNVISPSDTLGALNSHFVMTHPENLY